MAVIFINNSELLGTFADTDENSDFATLNGTFDTNPANATDNGVGSMSDTDADGPRVYSVTANSLGAPIVVAGPATIVATDYGTLIVNQDGTFSFTPDSDAINALDIGDVVERTFTIAVTNTDSEGGNADSDSATFTLRFTGEDDVPSLEGGVLATIDDTSDEDTFDVVGNLRIDNDPDGGVVANGVGQLVADRDAARTYALSDEGATEIVDGGTVVGTQLVTEYGTLMLANDGRYQFIPNSAAIDALDETDTLTVNITVNEGDQSDTAEFTIVLNGVTEDRVSLEGGVLATYTDEEAGADTYSVVNEVNIDTDETAASNGVGQLSGGTGDVSYMLTGEGVVVLTVGEDVVGTQLTTAYGTLTLGIDGRYEFSPNAAAIDALPASEDPFQVEFTVEVTDAGNETSDTAVFTVDINGFDDPVDLTGGELASYTDTDETDDFAVVQGQVLGEDVGTVTGDAGNTRAFYLVNGEEDGYTITEIMAGDEVVGTEIVTEYGRVIVATNGQYLFEPNDAAINALGEGDNPTLTFTVLVEDENGSSDTAQFTVSFEGAADDAFTVEGGSLASYYDSPYDEGYSEGGDNYIDDGGNYGIIEGQIDNSPFSNEEGEVGELTSDQDQTYEYTLLGEGVEQLYAGETVVGQKITTAYGTLTVASNGRYQFVPNDAAIDALGDEEVTLEFTVQVDGSEGGSTTAVFTVDLYGSNEVPQIDEGDYYYEFVESNATLAASGQIEATDPDGGTLTYEFQPFGNEEGSSYAEVYDPFTDSWYDLSDEQLEMLEGSFTVNPETGAYVFQLASPDILDPGQVLDINYLVTVTNEAGESSSVWIEVDIEGTIEAGPPGTANDDVLTGGEFGDAINAGGGDDIVYGGGGNDVINGGSGDDQLEGGAGNDTLRGGSGDDILVGGAGINTLDGGSGDFDIAVLPGDPDEYYVETNGSVTSFYHYWGDEEVYHLINVETLQFGNGELIDLTAPMDP